MARASDRVVDLALVAALLERLQLGEDALGSARAASILFWASSLLA